jgi:hypothetical protein
VSKLAEKLIQFNFQVCWGGSNGHGYGTKIEGGVEVTPSPWSISGHLRWYKNILNPGWAHPYKDNVPLVGLTICYEMSIKKFSTGKSKKPLELTCPVTGFTVKVDVNCAIIFCFAMSIELDSSYTDLRFTLSGGPQITIGFPAVGFEVAGKGTLYGMWTLKNVAFLEDGITYSNAELSNWWEVSLSANGQTMYGLRGVIMEDGDFQVEDATFHLGLPVRRRRRRRQRRRKSSCRRRWWFGCPR